VLPLVPVLLPDPVLPLVPEELDELVPVVLLPLVPVEPCDLVPFPEVSTLQKFVPAVEGEMEPFSRFANAAIPSAMATANETFFILVCF
jgi:hypothetical protein